MVPQRTAKSSEQQEQGYSRDTLNTLSAAHFGTVHIEEAGTLKIAVLCTVTSAKLRHLNLLHTWSCTKSPVP